MMHTLPSRKLQAFLALFILVVNLAACKAQQNNSDNVTGTNNAALDLNWTLLPFNKVDSVNPVLQPGNGSFVCPILNQQIKWENKDVFNPAVVVRDGKVYMLYRAEDTIGKHAGTSRIGLAVSNDGLHFTREKEPVFYPAEDEQKHFEWEGGVEDPRIVENEQGRYYMTYTAYDGTVARMLIASSTDLRNWTKHGHVFQQAKNGKYVNKWSKSGSIVSRYTNGKIVAAKINGKYWMYWGDKNTWLATSNDLINWTPVEVSEKSPAMQENEDPTNLSGLQVVFGPRQGMFDSDLVEPGPPAMLTNDGILLIYNGRNIRSTGDTTLAEGTYTASQVLMSGTDPSRVIKRMDTYFMRPDKPYEKTGQVNQVCFVEGLVHFKNRWFLYYGTADSKIAVAVKE